MLVTCDKCGRYYNDVNRWTTCPHDEIGGVPTFISSTPEKPMDQPEINPLSTKPDGTPRHASVAGVLKHFRFAHLPERLQAISKPCAELAIAMADALPETPDLTCGLRDLLTAKDNFVRAMV